MVIVYKYWKAIPMKFLVVHLIMKGIQLLLVVKIIRVEYGNVKRRGGVVGQRERVCVCGKDLNFQKSVCVHYLFEKKTLERRWCFFLKRN